MPQLLAVGVKLVQKGVVRPLLRRLEIEEGRIQCTVQFIGRHLKDALVRLISLLLEIAKQHALRHLWLSCWSAGHWSNDCCRLGLRGRRGHRPWNLRPSHMGRNRLSVLIRLIESVDCLHALGSLRVEVVLLLGHGAPVEKVVLIHDGVSKLLLDRGVVCCTDLLINIQRGRDTL